MLRTRIRDLALARPDYPGIHALLRREGWRVGKKPGVSVHWAHLASHGPSGYDSAMLALHLLTLALTASGAPSDTLLVRECDRPRPEWIWCDDFEVDRLDRYFEYGRAEGRFTRQPAVGVAGSAGMTARWARGEVNAGFLHLAFGRTPAPRFRPVDSARTDHRDVYWRFYLRNAPGWSGGGGRKLTRAIVFGAADWSTAAMAHVWSGGPNGVRLILDPASGVAGGRMATSGYNDNRGLRWLGAKPGTAPLFAPTEIGKWHCIEVQARLNDPTRPNGVFRLWIDGKLDVERADLDWVGTYRDYGINAVFLENYWNGGAPGPVERHFDRFVVSTKAIGC